MKGGDTSTAESGSEAEDMVSPKALRRYPSSIRLTPVREEVGHFFCQDLMHHLLDEACIWY